LISFIGAIFSRLKGCRFIYWVMDLNPDEAIVAGWLNERSFIARMLQRMSVFSLKQSDVIIVLDRFMKDRIAESNAPVAGMSWFQAPIDGTAAVSMARVAAPSRVGRCT